MSPDDLSAIRETIRSFPESDAEKLCWFLLGAYQESNSQIAQYRKMLGI